MRKTESPDPLSRAMKYCAYQERCHAEVSEKLKEWGVYGNEAASVLADLIEGGFLNEERFARAFAGGKFRTKQWGKLKIMRELKMRQISAYCIEVALEEISDEDYLKAMEKLITVKNKTIKEKNLLVRNNKLATFMMGKGYEPELIWKRLKSSNI